MNPDPHPLSGFRFHRLVQVPWHARPESRSTATDIADETVRGLVAALTGSHADLLAAGDNAALLTGWVRSGGDRQVRHIVGGRPYFPPSIGSRSPAVVEVSHPVLFPPGALGTELAGPDVEKMLGEFPYWLPCLGHPDALWATPEGPDRAEVRRGSFDRFVAHVREPFAWLVLARPLRPEQLHTERDGLVNAILPLARGELSEAKRVDLERKQARHRELVRSQLGGFWRVRVLVGGMDPRGVTSAAAMLCAASELDGLPYGLLPGDRPRSFAEATGADVEFSAGTRLVAALTRPPDRELPGLRLVRPHSFDVTPENPTDTSGLLLGQVLDEAHLDVGDFRLSADTLNRHTFVCGATGTGKSQTIRHLLEQATRTGIPWLVIEPAKAEYARMATRIADLDADVIVIRPNDPDQPPAGLNPLQPAPGFPLQTHADLLRALFLASFEAQEPFPQILATALSRCYEELGWDLTLGEPIHATHQPRYPTLTDLQRVSETVVDEIGYGKEVADNVRGFIAVRLSSLRLGTTGRFFEGGHPIDFAHLHRRNVVLEIEDVGDDMDKAFFMGVVLIRLVEHLRTTTPDGDGSGLRHLTVIEEAHRLLRRSETGNGPASHAVEMFASLLAEVRAYGEGLVIAEQVPGKLIPDVIKNTAAKIMHRLPALDDRTSVGATMNLDQTQSEYAVTLGNGEACVFTDGMDRPMLIRVPDGTVFEANGLEATGFEATGFEATGLEATGHGSAAPCRSLITSRSATCGARCVDEPCTLREIRYAQRILDQEPWLVVWVEFTVLAHLAGHPTPRPVTVPTLPDRLGECAISQAVDAAVANRSTVLQPDADAVMLADHIAMCIRDMLQRKESPCDGDAMRYLARPYRWERIRHTLATDPQLDASGRHPDSAEWERQHRRLIPGDTRREQLDAVTRWAAAAFEDRSQRDVVTFGARRPSPLEQSIGVPVTDGEWPGHVEGALRWFVDRTWPRIHLAPESM